MRKRVLGKRAGRETRVKEMREERGEGERARVRGEGERGKGGKGCGRVRERSGCEEE